MPANKNAVTRYYILDNLLSNRYHNYSTEDLLQLVNEKLAELGQNPVSRRTIELDLHYLEYDGPFLAEIDHYQIDDVNPQNNKSIKKYCHRYTDPSFSIFKKKMTEDEKFLLSEAFSILKQFDGLPNLKGLDNLRESLNIRTNKQIISFTKNIVNNSSLLNELFTTIAQKQVIELHYHRFDSLNEDKLIVVNPYLLKEYNLRWYLIASAYTDGKLLTIALDRILSIAPLPTKKYIQYAGDINERFEDIIGITLNENNPLLTILFWVKDSSIDYVKTKPLHESQRHYREENEITLRKQYPIFEGGGFFSIECIENYELIRELTAFGKDLIVLSPKDIQDKVFKRISETHEIYHLLRK